MNSPIPTQEAVMGVIDERLASGEQPPHTIISISSSVSDEYGLGEQYPYGCFTDERIAFRDAVSREVALLEVDGLVEILPASEGLNDSHSNPVIRHFSQTVQPTADWPAAIKA